MNGSNELTRQLGNENVGQLSTLVFLHVPIRKNIEQLMLYAHRNCVIRQLVVGQVELDGIEVPGVLDIERGRNGALGIHAHQARGLSLFTRAIYLQARALDISTLRYVRPQYERKNVRIRVRNEPML